MKLKTASNKIMLISAVLLAAAPSLGLLYSFILIKGEKEARMSIFNSLAEVRAGFENFSAEQELYKETAEEREKLFDFVIKKDGIVEFIKKVEFLGAAAGVDLEVESVKTEELKDGMMEEVFLVFSARGRFNSTVHLLSMLENLPLDSSLERANLSAMPNSDGKANWRLSASMRALKVRGD